MGSLRCSIIGLGKLGACMAAAMASKNIKVFGVDLKHEIIEAFNKKKAPFNEPSLAEFISLYGHRIKATDDYRIAVEATDFTFVVVPTPSQKNGNFSLRYVIESVRKIGRILASKKKYHNVIITSTVLPGSMEYAIKPALEQASGKRCGKDFGLSYSPEFIALGSVIRDFLNPDFCLIGESDREAGNRLEVLYKQICNGNLPTRRMSFINAEITKIALNTYVTTKITYANSLAMLCERLPGANIDVVTETLGLDSRIGSRYLKGGLGYGGPCFPRDNAALAWIARRSNTRFMLAECTDKVNRQAAKKLVAKIQKYIRPKDTTALLGLSYKPHSDVVEESQGFYLARQLINKGYKVIVYDPMVSKDKCSFLCKRATFAKSIKEALHNSDIVVIANPDPAFMKIKLKDFPKRKRPAVVIDCWRILLKKLSNHSKIKYIPLGIGNYDRYGPGYFEKILKI